MAKQYSEEEMVRRDNAVKAIDSLLFMMQMQGINIDSPEAYLSIVKFVIGILAISVTGIEHNLEPGFDEVEIEPYVEAAKKLASNAIEDAAEYSAFLARYLETPEE